METQNFVLALEFDTPRAKLIQTYQKLLGYANWQYSHVILIRLADDGTITLIDNHNERRLPCVFKTREVTELVGHIMRHYNYTAVWGAHISNPASVRRLYTRHCVPFLLVPLSLWFNIGKICTYNVSKLLGFSRQVCPAAIIDDISKNHRGRQE